MTTFQKEKCLYSKKIETLGYMSFYIALTSIFSFINIPFITMSVNIIGLTLLSFLYSKNLSFNLQVTVVVYFIAMTEELFFVCASNSSLGNIFIKEEHRNILIVFLYNMTLLLSAIFLRYRVSKRQISVAPSFNLLISLITIIITAILIEETNMSIEHITIILALFLSINILSIKNYEQITSLFNKYLEIEQLNQKTLFYEKELKLMNEILKETRKYRHDEKNHILALQGLVKEKSYDKLQTYLEDMLKTFAAMGDNIIKSENEVINSILNYKIKNMAENHIKIKADVYVKEKLPISDYDISVILGNMLDNAAEAVTKIPEENRFIDIYISDERNKFIIKIKNTFDGKLNMRGKNLETTKENKQEHGIGINSINDTVKKYDGFFETTYDEKEFTAYIMILYD